MLSINTNIPSLIAHRSLNNSTKLLNQAIERMTTGFKINHASDNAANYSISMNMGVKLSSYEVAEDNVAMGLDLLSTASGSLDLISDKLSRLRALAEQASNGTYGEQSLKAINSEAKAIRSEINKIYLTAEYNGVKLFGETSQTEGFIKSVTHRDTSSMTKLSEIDATQALTSGVYSISTAEELAKLAEMTNNEKIGANTEFVLANDIDLSAYSDDQGWIPIGFSFTESKKFHAIFDGNGYVVTNLVQNIDLASNTCGRGLFGVLGASSEVKNLGIENANIHNDFNSGILAGVSYGSVSNCYTTGVISTEKQNAGGLIGVTFDSTSSTKNCYSTADVSVLSGANAGGFIGSMSGSTAENCYSTGDINGKHYVGGFAGHMNSDATITDCIALGNVYGTHLVGGFIGGLRDAVIKNSSSNGDVSGDKGHDYPCAGGFVGGSIGNGNVTIENCSQSGSVDFNNGYVVGQFCGGLEGTNNVLRNCYALGQSENVDGSILGGYYSNHGGIIENCYYNSYYEDKVDTLGMKSSRITEINSKSCNNYNMDTIMQCGINSSASSQIIVDTKLKYNLFKDLYNYKISDGQYLTKIDEIIMQISSKQTDFGAVENRLESALEEISTQYDNLVSSRSTLRDADIAEVSSEYIRQQILQQASATLMATANQSPALALQLI